MTSRALRSDSMPASQSSASSPVHYPASDNMGEHELQRLIMEVLRPLIERWLRSRGVTAHAGADTFFYYVKGDPTHRIAPDIYVLEGVPQDEIVASWKMWELGRAPSFALEIVSGDALKDYDDVPAVLGRLGTRELVLFDPEARAGSKRRARWTVFRRRERGFLREVQTFDDRVRSEVLGAWLRVVGSGASRRIRLALDPNGDALFATEVEEARREIEDAQREIERLRKELARRG